MKKNQLCNCLVRFGLALALAAVAWLPSQALAQEKGATKLMQLKRLDTNADVEKLEAGDTVVMSCPKCKETWVTVVEKPMKGAGVTEKKNIARHECPGCDSKLVTEGVGKQATTKVQHTCKKCGSTDAFCCVMKKGTGPTAGMEDKK